MATSRKNRTTAKSSDNSQSSKKSKNRGNLLVSAKAGFKKSKASFIGRRRFFLSRRPHRTFRMTKRRDYKRSLKLPGYVAFTVYVASVLKKRKALFILLALFYGVLSVVLGGISSQQSYSEISSLLREGSAELLNGGMSKIGQASILSVTAFTGANRVTSDVQQIYMSIVLLLT